MTSRPPDGSSREIGTSQIAPPAEACDVVFATEGDGRSVRDMARTALAADERGRRRLGDAVATTTGDVTNGLMPR